MSQTLLKQLKQYLLQTHFSLPTARQATSYKAKFLSPPSTYAAAQERGVVQCHSQQILGSSDTKNDIFVPEVFENQPIQIYSNDMGKERTRRQLDAFTQRVARVSPILRHHYKALKARFNSAMLYREHSSLSWLYREQPFSDTGDERTRQPSLLNEFRSLLLNRIKTAVNTTIFGFNKEPNRGRMSVDKFSNVANTDANANFTPKVGRGSTLSDGGYSREGDGPEDNPCRGLHEQPFWAGQCQHPQQLAFDLSMVLSLFLSISCLSRWLTMFRFIV
ncbi:hypothetical protein BT69DRAFT_153441 [Atractiella rhizophila]|nr:hypothetical protein BT69DRAFT_153441 [Atractiella rhizophila]